MRVKICGLHPVSDVQFCIDLKVDFLGFVFYDKSPRNLSLQDVQKLKEYKKSPSGLSHWDFKINFYLCFLFLNLPPLTSFSMKLPTCSPTSVNLTAVAPS